MKIITSGLKYLDIDAYACAVAYAELLNLQGVESRAVSTAELNDSIPQTVLSWGAALDTNYEPSPDDEFIVVDVSEPHFLDKIVTVDRVVEVIDHHVGFEDFWRHRIGEKVDIEFIGAACTQIYERWLKSGLFNEMSTLSARLLVCGILDNTLNFGANVTTQRDIDAYNMLLTKADLPEDWPAIYFDECGNEIMINPARSLVSDTKIVTFSTYPEEIVFGQLVIWDGKEIIDDYRDTLETAISELSRNWMINVVSVGEKRNYIMASNPDIRAWLADLLDISFEDSIATTNRLWLRKEIIKQDLDNK